MAVSISFQSIPGAPPYPVSSHPGLWPTDRPHSGRRERTPIPSSSLAAQLNKVAKQSSQINQSHFAKHLHLHVSRHLLKSASLSVHLVGSWHIHAYPKANQRMWPVLLHHTCTLKKEKADPMLCQLRLSDFYDVQKQIHLSCCTCGL